MSQLQWACRRGMLELDVLLGSFLKARYPALSAENKQRFHDLLDCSDPELFAWLMGHEQPHPAFANITEMVREHAKSNI